MATKWITVLGILVFPVTGEPTLGNTAHEQYEGLYSGRVENYQVVVPVRLGSGGGRGRRGVGVDYALEVDGSREVVELEPSPSLLGPGFDIRRGRRPSSLPSHALHCHFRGTLRGRPSSSVALSTCHDRLVGVLRTSEGEFWLEPVKVHNSSTGYPHLLYKRTPPIYRHSRKYRNKRRKRRNLNCGTKEPRRVTSPLWKRKSLEGKFEDKDLKRQTRSATYERHVETLVVADTSMVNFHKEMDLETYLLTIMNMVSSTYQDPSIGHNIKIVVVRIIILEDDIGEGLNITVNGDETLKNFCNWQLKNNPTNDDHPNHHDVAILITRKDICAKKNLPCSTLGIAHVGGMCQPERSCNINEDNGIILAHTITHELGHNFGMYHDTPQAGCEGREGPILHVMTPNFEADTTYIAWSGCSRRDLNHFLGKGMGYCLEDLPTPNEQQTSVELPLGAMYSAEHQCKIQFGSNSTLCTPLEEICAALWCIEGDQCITNLNPAASGTRCGPEKWCLNQNCVPVGEGASPVNGGWGDWGSWTSCSRSCGGGIALKERLCDAPVPAFGGKFCPGDRLKYKVCNTKSCPEGSPSFRYEQCSVYNHQDPSGKNYTFLPYFEKTEPCHLYCSNVEDPFIEPFGDTVLDGTPCNVGTKDMCIAGLCRKVGCDWAIDSDATEDRCGICLGNGSDCTALHGEFSEKLNSGNTEVIVIPIHSRHIHLDERGSFRNYISIGNMEKDTFFLNGKREISTPGEFVVAGTIGTYERRKEKEKVFIPGPIKEPIIIYLTNRGKAQVAALHYEYTTSKTTRKYIKKYDWTYEWSQCSKICGGGIKTRSAFCYDIQTQKKVKEINCDKKLSNLTQKCNEFSCNARWRTGPWQPCSTTCGKGLRRRDITCVTERNTTVEFHSGACDESLRPKDTSPCLNNPTCLRKSNATENYTAKIKINKNNLLIKTVLKKLISKKQIR